MSDSKIPVFDGHNDTILRLFGPERKPGASFFEEREEGHIDYARALKGGLAGGFFAMFCPRDPKGPPEPDYDMEKVYSGAYEFPLPDPLEYGYAIRMAMNLASNMIRVEKESEGRFKIIRTAQEIVEHLGTETITAIMHLEGADAIDTNFNALEVFYRAGLRSLGIVWSRPNDFGHGVPFKFPSSPDTGPGLTDAGVALVERCNAMGILIDLSHITEKGFWDVAKHSVFPLVATHACVHAISPSARNLTDKQLDAIKDTGGVMGLNFHVGFLRDDGSPDPNTPMELLLRHATYVIDHIGIDHIALGSDFDGATMPACLPTVAELPALLDALAEAGLDRSDLEKIAFKNWVRVLDQTLLPS